MGIEVLIPITMFSLVGVITFYWLKTRHELRMSIIEKGTRGDELKYLLGSFKRMSNKYSPAKWGILLISVGLAIIIGIILQTYGDFEEGIIFGLIFLFPGLGLLVYYQLFGKKIDENIINENREV